MTTFQPVSRRNAMIASVAHRNRSVHTPVSFVTSLSGFALRVPVRNAQTSHAAGTSPAAKIRGFATNRTRFVADTASVVLLQIHPGIKARHLIAIAVEDQ